MVLRQDFQVIREILVSKKGSSLQNPGSKELWIIGMEGSRDSLQLGADIVHGQLMPHHNSKVT